MLAAAVAEAPRPRITAIGVGEGPGEVADDVDRHLAETGTRSVTLGGALLADVDDVAGTLALVEGDARSSSPARTVAALAIEHGLVLASTDGDFARFEGLRWENPLAG